MTFNSYPFLFLFMPIVLVAMALTGWPARSGALTGTRRLWVIVLFSLCFYTLASPASLPFLLGSAAFNYVAAGWIARLEGDRRMLCTRLAVAANLLSLILCKYTVFLLENLAPALVPSHGLGVFLPLGLSFFTFQQISFLVDVSRVTTVVPRPLPYLASVSFFPSVISGPITYLREIFPQLSADQDKAVARQDRMVGMGQFSIGLFKKTVLADSFTLWVDPLFTQLHAGHTPSTPQAWMMVVGYLFQMYFDFSGYSDMALGLGRMMGVRLTLNFFSPFRVTTIMDWWRRWHISLGRFVNDYVFQSLALPLTRAAMMRRYGRLGVTAAGTLLPTAIAMFTIGAWHGGRWTYIVFGALHATYMVVAELWRFLTGRRKKVLPSWLRIILGHGLTMLCVLVALAPFRADTMADTGRLWLAMAGQGGFSALDWPFPGAVMGHMALAELLGALVWVYLLPNTAQIFEAFAPSLPSPLYTQAPAPLIRLHWRPGLAWGLFIGAAFALGAIFVSRGGGQFVYFAF